MSVGNDCARCHTPDNWLVNNIPEIHEQNGFPLVGTHSNLSCVDCHKSETNLRFDRLGNDCFNCHDDDYASAKNPDHVAAGYSTNCIECHDPLGGGWGANIIHDFFPLVGGHDIADCKRCHTTGNYADASPVCNTCHMPDYNNTTNPNHAHASISTNCADCHTIQSWSPANFDHNTIYPLRGAHAAIANDCNKCHSGGFTNTPNTCAGCHMPDYNNTTNPNHSSAQFSTDCTTCHNETSWTPSTFDHDGQFFPIYSGKHKGKWNQCTECHTTGNYSQFSCIDCHEHSNRNDVDDKHDGVSGYSYNSNACYSCHPDGRE
jgi:hypothetical protein